MDVTAVLGMVKARLNRLQTDTTLDEYLTVRITAAMQELESTGIHLSDTMEDMMLVVDMTTWQYQNRDKDTGMPDWLRLRRRERWIQQIHGGGTE